MRTTALAFSLLLATAHAQPLGSATTSSPAAANRFGSVQFTTSCAPSVQTDFNNAVAILHSFEYDEARVAFAAIVRKDPSCAMAHWGEAMSYFHGLWGEFNATEGAKATADARATAAQNPRTTPREEAYIAAITQIFSDQAIQRSQGADNQPDVEGYSRPAYESEAQYTASMAALHAQFPDDREATIFYALALAISAKSSDKTHADLHHCTALLKPLFVEMPNHPGVTHYIIHCDDNPDMAADGLAAARKYAQIAPASAHATHMPAHIFAQLGLWDEMVNSNRLSLHAAEQDTNASPCERLDNSLHAMSFLVVGLSELGQVAEARNVVQHSLTFKSTVPGAAQCPVTANAVLFSYMFETSDWSMAKDFSADPADWTYWFATGIAAARTGDTVRADTAEQHLAALRDASARLPGHNLQNPLEVYRLTVAAWRAHQAGRQSEAVLDMRQAADLADRLSLNYATYKPIREMLADLLLADNQPAPALTEYKAVLARKPNRFDSLYGAGSAAYALGDPTAASTYYSQLLSFAKGDERSELAIARSRTQPASKLATSTTP